MHQAARQRASARSLAVRPPGSGEGAGAAQRLGCGHDGSRPARPGPRSGRRSARRRGRPPAWRPPGSAPSSPPPRHPAAHHLATQPQRRHGTAPVGRPGPFGYQRPDGDPDRGQPEHGPEVQGEAGTAGIIASGGVDQQHLGGGRQGAHGLLEQRSLAQREQGQADLGDAGTTVAHPYGGHPVKPELATWPMFRLDRGATLCTNRCGRGRRQRTMRRTGDGRRPESRCRRG